MEGSFAASSAKFTDWIECSPFIVAGQDESDGFCVPERQRLRPSSMTRTLNWYHLEISTFRLIRFLQYKILVAKSISLTVIGQLRNLSLLVLPDSHLIV